MLNNIIQILPLPIMVAKQPRVGHDVLHEWLELQGVRDMDCYKDYVAEKENKTEMLDIWFSIEKKDAIAWIITISINTKFCLLMARKNKFYGSNLWKEDKRMMTTKWFLKIFLVSCDYKKQINVANGFLHASKIVDAEISNCVFPFISS